MEIINMSGIQWKRKICFILSTSYNFFLYLRNYYVLWNERKTRDIFFYPVQFFFQSNYWQQRHIFNTDAGFTAREKVPVPLSLSVDVNIVGYSITVSIRNTIVCYYMNRWLWLSHVLALFQAMFCLSIHK